jgi:hypothetical protein
MRAFLRVTAVAAAAGLFLAPAAGAASAATTTHHGSKPSAVAVLRGGTTTVTVTKKVTGVLLGAGIVPVATAPGNEQLVNGTNVRFHFPVTGGRASLSPLFGQVHHSGGIKFINLGNGKSVKVSRFTIHLGAKTLTGIVNNDPHARIKIFNLDLSHARIHVAGHWVHVTRIGLNLASGAAHALNASLGVSAFAGGLKVANASTNLRI